VSRPARAAGGYAVHLFARRATGGFSLLLSVVLAGVAAVAGWAADSPAPRFVGPTLKHPAIPPDFVLLDQHLRVVHLSGQRGKVVLLTFLYTHCPDVCPLTAINLNAALGLVGQARKNVVVLAVSVDPRGDTPAAVKAFARSHRLRPQFHYLTGSEKALELVWRAYKVAAVRHGDKGVDHTLYTLLVDPTGKARVVFDSLARPAAIAHDVRQVLP
jgi:protein SCO1/2